ncbi:MAG: PD-(D/E)XK nuclease domain-containing protein, partial [Prevotella sp.]|nr:PD-(D/E)XK nuclease domain-containing protein [Prevotella sp.]
IDLSKINHRIISYYKNAGTLPADCDIEAMIEEMRPWYDNYCFAEECLKDNNRVFFLLPNMTHYQSNHSYILELKYLSKSDYTEKNAQEQWDEAVEQINGYAVAPRVEALRQGTQLHKIIIQFCGWDMIKMREV